MYTLLESQLISEKHFQLVPAKSPDNKGSFQRWSPLGGYFGWRFIIGIYDQCVYHIEIMYMYYCYRYIYIYDILYLYIYTYTIQNTAILSLNNYQKNKRTRLFFRWAWAPVVALCLQPDLLASEHSRFACYLSTSPPKKSEEDVIIGLLTIGFP